MILFLIITLFVILGLPPLKNGSVRNVKIVLSIQSSLLPKKLIRSNFNAKELTVRFDIVSFLLVIIRHKTLSIYLSSIIAPENYFTIINSLKCYEKRNAFLYGEFLIS